MQFGVNLINYGPGVSPSSLLRWATLAESLGYHAVMISDHVAVTPDVRERYPEPFYDAYTTLAWLAGQTRSIKLGTTVIVVPYRHPVLMARMGANLDHLSGGRFIFGVGVGSAEKEYTELKVPFDKRGGVANDFLAAVKALWTQEVVTHSGKYVSFKDVSGIKPFQTPHPPIWVGGSSDAAMRRLIRFGDAWHPNRFTLPWLRDTGLPTVKRMAQKAGRPVPALCPRIRMHLTDTPLPEEERPVGAGSLDQVRRDLHTLQELGAQFVLLDWYRGDLEATRHHEEGWRMLATLAERALDLQKEALR